MFASPTFTGTTGMNTVNVSGLATYNIQPEDAVKIDINATGQSNVRPSGLILDVLTASTEECGTSIEFRVNDGTEFINIGRVTSRLSDVGRSMAFELFDATNITPIKQIEAVEGSVFLNGGSIIIKQKGIFTVGAEEDFIPNITVGADLTLYPAGNVVTYGNVVPGSEGVDQNTGDPATIPSGTFDIGSDSARYKDLYLAGVILTEVPATAAGAEGDVAGMMAFDGSYIYRCSTDWTDGLTDIWGRTNVTYNTW
jgi:hypothetical protein